MAELLSLMLSHKHQRSINPPSMAPLWPLLFLVRLFLSLSLRLLRLLLLPLPLPLPFLLLFLLLRKQALQLFSSGAFPSRHNTSSLHQQHQHQHRHR